MLAQKYTVVERDESVVTDMKPFADVAVHDRLQASIQKATRLGLGRACGHKVIISIHFKTCRPFMDCIATRYTFHIFSFKAADRRRTLDKQM